MRNKFIWLVLSFLLTITLVVVSCGISTKVDDETLPPTTGAPDEEKEKWIADGVLGDTEYLSEMSYGNYEIRWLSDDQYIYIGIRAKTTGWVAVGVKPTSAMKDADMVIGFIKDGLTTVSDQFSTGIYGPHSPDTDLGGANNILDFDGKEEDGYTTIEFKRALSTGDEYDNEFNNGKNEIIWSYGSSDEKGQRHIVRGYGEINL